MGVEATYNVLVVEDDAAVRNLITTTLEVHGYRYRAVKNGAQALLELTSASDIDLVILDLGLPDKDGVDIIRTVRGWSHVPIIVVSARLEDVDKVEALDAGADDYLVKPFSVEELLARLRVALRRLSYEAPTDGSEVYENDMLCIDYAAGCVTCAQKEIHLTPMEYNLLCLLAHNTGKVLTHTYILKEVWGSSLVSDIPSLRVFMATLRKKIEIDPSNPRYIQTHVGVGYRMMRQE